jgi:TetR/AcrR family transcriptional repressor of nem operon
MGRPKGFNRETALASAIAVFADNGFEGTSTETLLDAMGINRQSLYDTFGSKRALYLEALMRYNGESAALIVGDIQGGATPAEGIQRAVVSFAQRAGEARKASCLGVSSILEFGLRDEAVAAAGTASHGILMASPSEAITQAQSYKELRADIKAGTAADYILTAFAGLKVSARAGMPPESLRQMAQLAFQALSPVRSANSKPRHRPGHLLT